MATPIHEETEVRDHADDEDLILDHVASPYHRGCPPEATCSALERNPLCGDELRLYLLIDETADRIIEAHFAGRGCAISQAAASILCEHIEAKTVKQLAQMQPETMLDLLQVKLAPQREVCALLAFRAMRKLCTDRMGRH